ncbi:MAG: hypothetical protein M1828_007091 [Chrysothrix sp. TS-e1954]|nr:MAG: hypothetical protein M1828_007091 [Chrysothrix sp. TS-e1954]
MYDDASQVVEDVTSLANAGHSIIVVMHSYGGIAGSGITSDLSITSLAYQTNDPFEPQASLSQMKVTMNNNGRLTILNGPECFYGDLPSAEQKRWEETLVPWVVSVGSTRTTLAPWMDHNTTYVACDKDAAVVYPLQQKLIAEAKASTKAEMNEEVLHGSSHSPFLSRVSDVVAIITKTWQKENQGL